jgi:hypothetical protein
MPQHPETLRGIFSFTQMGDDGSIMFWHNAFVEIVSAAQL